MTLKNTIDGMLSADYKERLKAEYHQLKIRTEGLQTTLENYSKGTLNFSPDIKQISLMFKQLWAMRDYMLFLELRANNDNIDLSE